ncbi:MAG: hypothetical protein WCK42_09940, partial [Myxococcaceae bacterium]
MMNSLKCYVTLSFMGLQLASVANALFYEEIHTAPNEHVRALITSDPDPRIQKLLVDLQQNYPEFFALGGAEGRIYRISDPANKVNPFLLSHEARFFSGESYYQFTMTHYESKGY